ncbi:MAG: YfhO family protein, partial [Thermoanaerobaculia bacterium]
VPPAEQAASRRHTAERRRDGARSAGETPALHWALLALIAGQRLMSEVDTFSTYPAELAWPKLALLAPLEHIKEPFRIVGRGDAFPPATNTFYGLEDVRGYEALTLAELVQTWPRWSRPFGTWYQRVDELENPFLSLMNVRFAIQSSALPVPAGWRLVMTHKGSALIENEHVIDRIFVPERVVVGGMNTGDMLTRMIGLRDFRTLAWIDAPGAIVERGNGPGRITLRSRSRGGEYVFDADMQGDGWAVISDSSWEGWRAYVNSRRVKMSRANAAFLSVYLPAGKQTVRVVYMPTSFVRGRAITFATLIVLVMVIVLRLRQRHVLQRE